MPARAHATRPVLTGRPGIGFCFGGDAKTRVPLSSCRPSDRLASWLRVVRGHMHERAGPVERVGQRVKDGLACARADREGGAASGRLRPAARPAARGYFFFWTAAGL